MKDTYEYKGYVGSAEVDIEGSALVGKLLYIRDTITYSASSPADLESAFREAVDDYLRACAEDGSEPDVPCKGSFNVRVGALRHRNVAIAARRAGVGLNEFVCTALDEAVAVGTRTILHRHRHEVSLQVTSTGHHQEWTALTHSQLGNTASDGPKH